MGTQVETVTRTTGILNPGEVFRTLAGRIEDLQTTTEGGEVGEACLHQDHLQLTIAKTQGDLHVEGHKHRSCTGHQDAGGDLLSTIARKRYIENNRM